jgi:hypothetical protein
LGAGIAKLEGEWGGDDELPRPYNVVSVRREGAVSVELAFKRMKKISQ